VQQRILLENLLKSYPNCLNLRPVFPTTSYPGVKDLLGKLIHFKKLIAIPTSITVMDELWPLIVPMCEQKITGTFNFTNPGVIDNNQIMKLYQKYVDPNKTWELASEEEVKQMIGSRPAAELDVSKLKALFPELKSVHDAVETMMKKIALQKNISNPSQTQ
jgi:hypothetical protein